MKLIDQLKWRYAVKDFDSSKKLSDEQINTLQQALQLSVSSFGLQPYRFIIVKDPALREKLVPASYGQTKVSNAALFIVFCIETKLDNSVIERYLENLKKVNTLSEEALHNYARMLQSAFAEKSQVQKEEWSARQLYISIGHLITVASAMDIDTCAMEGFYPKSYSEILGLDELGLKACAAVALGYRSPDDHHQFLKKVRRPIDDLFIIK